MPFFFTGQKTFLIALFSFRSTDGCPYSHKFMYINEQIRALSYFIFTELFSFHTKVLSFHW